MDLEQAVFRMIEVMLKDQGIQALTNEASRVLERPLWLTDLNYHFLTNPGAIYPVGEELLDSYRFGMLGKDRLVYLHRKRISEIINQHKGPYVYFDESISSTLAVTAVRVRDVVVAHLVAGEAEHPIGEFDIAFLNRLKDIMSLELQRRSSALQESKSVSSLVMSEMLERKCSKMEHVYNRLEAAKYTICRNLRLVVVCRVNEGKDDFPWPTVLEQIALVFQRSLYAEYHGCLVLLMNQDNDMSGYQAEQLEQILRLGNLKAGVSYRFQDLARLYQVYGEVRDLIDTMERLSAKRALYRYEECIVEMAASHLIGKLDPHSIAGDSLSRLIDYDRQYGQETLPTLKAYVECSFNIKRTAKKLHVHENTMRYRAGRLEEIMGIKLDNSRSIFELVLALTMLEFDRTKK